MKCYFSNIFGEPDLSGKGWNGFTRDWQQMECAFSIESQHPVPIDDIDEYLTDVETEGEYKFININKLNLPLPYQTKPLYLLLFLIYPSFNRY